jgi:hypothetical protein
VGHVLGLGVLVAARDRQLGIQGSVLTLSLRGRLVDTLLLARPLILKHKPLAKITQRFKKNTVTH